MNSTIMLSAALGVILAKLLPLSARSSRGNAESGRLYAVNRCTLCHSVEPKTDGTGQYAPDFTVIARRRATTTRSLKEYIRSDHALMPNFLLSPTGADDIVAYILSLKLDPRDVTVRHP